jgi:ketosteroid isomerase-like protein
MKKVFPFLTFVLLLGISCSNQSTELTDEQKVTIQNEVQVQMDGKITAARQLDADAFIDYFSNDEFISVNSGATYYSSLSVFADSVANWYSLRESRNTNQIESKITVLAPDLALGTRVLYSENLFKSGELLKSNTVITELWKKEQSGWKVIHFHESSKPITEE